MLFGTIKYEPLTELQLNLFNFGIARLPYVKQSDTIYLVTRIQDNLSEVYFILVRINNKADQYFNLNGKHVNAEDVVDFVQTNSPEIIPAIKHLEQIKHKRRVRRN